ncbi:hypothetical protein HPB49_005066 [Dermacentor silvarum]|uniref:Uncharacterized protein n=1 Tax=Dermacentor silvarum TaxID=543639 RepID=A0ACB8CDA3_DERSI|nr:hypothetical protein HPB49_005066 [Dermacentor silvarum]
MSRITSEIRKYELLLEALPAMAIADVRDILLLPLSNITATCRLVPSEHHRLQQLLSIKVLGDRCATHFAHHLQHLLGDTADSLDTAALRELFLRHIPVNVRFTVVSANKRLLP